MGKFPILTHILNPKPVRDVKEHLKVMDGTILAHVLRSFRRNADGSPVVDVPEFPQRTPGKYTHQGEFARAGNARLNSLEDVKMTMGAAIDSKLFPSIIDSAMGYERQWTAISKWREME